VPTAAPTTAPTAAPTAVPTAAPTWSGIEIGNLTWIGTVLAFDIIDGALAAGSFTLTIFNITTPPSVRAATTAALTTKASNGDIIDGSADVVISAVVAGSLGGALTFVTADDSVARRSQAVVSFTTIGSVPVDGIITILLPSVDAQVGWDFTQVTAVTFTTAGDSLPTVSGGAITSTDSGRGLQFLLSDNAIPQETAVVFQVDEVISPTKVISAATSTVITTKDTTSGTVDTKGNVGTDAITISSFASSPALSNAVDKCAVSSDATVTFTTQSILKAGGKLSVFLPETTGLSEATARHGWYLPLTGGACTAEFVTVGGISTGLPTVASCTVSDSGRKATLTTATNAMDQDKAVVLTINNVKAPSHPRAAETTTVITFVDSADNQVSTFNSMATDAFPSRGEIEGAMTFDKAASTAKVQFNTSGEVSLQTKIRLSLPTIYGGWNFTDTTHMKFTSPVAYDLGASDVTVHAADRNVTITWNPAGGELLAQSTMVTLIIYNVEIHEDIIGESDVEAIIDMIDATDSIFDKGYLTFCPSGRYHAHHGSETCVDCAAGKYGHHSAHSGEATCDSCPGGYYQSADAQTKCHACIVGTYLNATASTTISDCIDCIAGKYIDVTGSDSVADCIECPLGQYIDVTGSDNVADCIDCIAGRYIDVTGSDSLEDCINCPLGQYIDVTGSDSVADCIDCVLGKYIDVTGSDSLADCIDCPLGQYIDVTGSDNMTDCINCPLGQYIDVTGSDNVTDCINCIVGQYINVTGSDVCIDCVLGKYIDVTGSDSLEDCINCPLGQYIDVTGSDNVTDCINCVAGKYIDVTGSDEASDCINCVLGKYIDVTGSDSLEDCINCIAGKYIDVTGSDEASDCINCVLGKYIDVTGSDSLADCIDCVLGKYIDVTGSDEASDCIDCIAGKYIDVTGSDSLEDCINCVLGKYIDVTGSDNVADCIDCVLGKYIDVTGSDSLADCIDCPLGQFLNMTGSDNVADCTDCPMGRFVNATGSVNVTNCEYCPTGYWLPTAGNFSCHVCDRGSFKSVEGSATSCDLCDAGQFQNSEGANKCVDCNREECTDGMLKLGCSGVGSVFDARCVGGCASGWYNTGQTLSKRYTCEMVKGSVEAPSPEGWRNGSAIWVDKFCKVENPPECLICPKVSTRMRLT
jgi:hypothetical protein